MATTTLNKHSLDIYINFFNNLDKKSKKVLISKLNNSLEIEKKKKDNLKELFGSWKDTKSADEIISEIRNSRINKLEIEEF